MHDSVTNNSVPAGRQRSPEYEHHRSGGYASKERYQQQDGYKSLRNRSGGRHSNYGRSPGRGTTGTYDRNGEPLDDPDYSLSVSELNSNLGNSLLKSATRGIGPIGGNHSLSPDSAPRFPEHRY